MRHVAVCIALATALAAPCFGWGGEGHRLLVRIAESFRTPPARTQVSTPLMPGVSLHDLPRWAGTVRRARKDTEESHYARFWKTLRCDNAKSTVLIGKALPRRKLQGTRKATFGYRWPALFSSEFRAWCSSILRYV